MFLYLVPIGGFNDILCGIAKGIDFCKKHNRILMIDLVNSYYKINCSDYFSIDNTITDIKQIHEIIKNKQVHPNINLFQLDISTFHYKKGTFIHTQTETVMDLPNENPEHDIVFSIVCGGGKGYPLFKQIKFNPKVVNYCKYMMNKIKKPYLCIQVRNTDRVSKYKKLYEDNKNLIKSFKTVYIATDSADVLTFFRSKCNVINYCSFPTVKCKNLHESEISGDRKIKELVLDLCIGAHAKTLLSNSMGGYIALMRACHASKYSIKN